MEKFNIIEYLGGLTSFVFDKSVLTRIAYDRGVIDVDDYSLLDKSAKDLCLADLLFIAYTSPNVIASLTNQHGAYTQTVGAQTINSKSELYDIMYGIYRKYGEEDKLELLAEPDNEGFIEIIG